MFTDHPPPGPNVWQECSDDDGFVYWICTLTMETVWEEPQGADVYIIRLPGSDCPPPPGAPDGHSASIGSRASIDKPRPSHAIHRSTIEKRKAEQKEEKENTKAAKKPGTINNAPPSDGDSASQDIECGFFGCPCCASCGQSCRGCLDAMGQSLLDCHESFRLAWNDYLTVASIIIVVLIIIIIAMAATGSW